MTDPPGLAGGGRMSQHLAMDIEIRRFAGEETRPWLTDAARLRIAVFREYPYLYQGNEAYERDYLHHYARCPRAVLVLALVEGLVVGVSTGLPLADADPAFRRPFDELGRDVAGWFYFGESVLDPAWRGRGIGHRFFDEREAHARESGFRHAAFCAVIRPANHPLRPADYRSHEAFWTKRGFVRHPEMTARLEWEQVDSEGREVENELVFWTRDL